MPENPAIIGHELREEKQECLDFYNHWLGKDYVKCQGCSSYVQRGKGFPETSNNPTNCSQKCRDLSFGRAMVKPTRYFQGEKLFELKDGQLVEIVEKPED